MSHNNEKAISEKNVIFIAKTYCCASSSYEVNRGDQIKIIQDMGDYVLVELIGRKNIPQVIRKDDLYDIAVPVVS